MPAPEQLAALIQARQNANASYEQNRGLATGIFVVVIVVPILVVIGICVGGCICWRRMKRKREQREAEVARIRGKPQDGANGNANPMSPGGAQFQQPQYGQQAPQFAPGYQNGYGSPPPQQTPSPINGYNNNMYNTPAPAYSGPSPQQQPPQGPDSLPRHFGPAELGGDDVQPGANNNGGSPDAHRVSELDPDTSGQKNVNHVSPMTTGDGTYQQATTTENRHELAPDTNTKS